MHKHVAVFEIVAKRDIVKTNQTFAILFLCIKALLCILTWLNCFPELLLPENAYIQKVYNMRRYFGSA